MAIRGKKIAVRKPALKPVARRVQPTPRPMIGKITPVPTGVVESPMVAKDSPPSEVVGPAAEVGSVTSIGRSSTLKQMGVITH